MKNKFHKFQLAINTSLNQNSTGIPHTDIVPRAEIIFVQTDTTMVECYLNCTPEITDKVKSVPQSQLMAFKIFMLLGQLAKSGQLMELIDATEQNEG